MGTLIKFNYSLLIIIIIVIVATFSLKAEIFKADDDPNGYDEVGKTVAELIRARGFKAENHYLNTTDGYTLNIVKANNPFINNGESGLDEKDVILFIHGIRNSGNIWILNSIGARPKDYGEIDAGELSLEELNDKLSEDPASKSLVYTALNFGHEVWILNRRGANYGIKEKFFASPHVPIDEEKLIIRREEEEVVGFKQQASDRSSAGSIVASLVEVLELPPNAFLSAFDNVDPKRWNYSFDPQAKYDFPETIEYILKQTDREKLSVVAHSAGGAITLMGLSMNPDINDKISKALLWAPAIDLGGGQILNNVTTRIFESWFRNYIGPSPRGIFLPLIKRLILAICQDQMGINIACQRYCSLNYGETGNQMDIKPGILASAFGVVSSHEYAQLLQSIFKGKTYYYDYRDAERNFIAYGQPEPPIYDLSTITTKSISIWWGNTDSLVTPKAIDQIIDDLQVPIEEHFFNQTGIYWNHVSFMFHKNISTLLIIPALKTLES